MRGNAADAVLEVHPFPLAIVIASVRLHGMCECVGAASIPMRVHKLSVARFDSIIRDLGHGPA